jgi:hypothetical protein
MSANKRRRRASVGAKPRGEPFRHRPFALLDLFVQPTEVIVNRRTMLLAHTRLRRNYQRRAVPTVILNELTVVDMQRNKSVAASLHLPVDAKSECVAQQLSILVNCSAQRVGLTAMDVTRNACENAEREREGRDTTRTSPRANMELLEMHGDVMCLRTSTRPSSKLFQNVEGGLEAAARSGGWDAGRKKLRLKLA